jgi:hypothetical protein
MRVKKEEEGKQTQRKQNETSTTKPQERIRRGLFSISFYSLQQSVYCRRALLTCGGLRAVVDHSLELRVHASVHTRVLGEEVDRLVAQTTQAVGQNVPRVAILLT